MRTIFTIAFAALFSAVSCGKMVSGIEDTVSVPVDTDYSVLNVSSAIAVEYSSAAESLEFTADIDILPYLVAERRGGVLELRMKPNRYRNVGRVKAVVPASGNIRKMELSGASSLDARERLEAPSFEVVLSGASDMTAEIVADNLSVKVSGASDLDVSGFADVLDMDVSGASSVSADRSRVSAETVRLDVSGASRVFVDCTGSIRGSVSGASSVWYGRNAVHADIDNSGASSSVPR